MPLNHYVTLGRSGLRVSPLCLGAMTFGEDWGWGSDVPTTGRIIDAYLDRGGNFLDTANVYTKGHSEKIIGDHLGRHASKRDRVVLATKFMSNLFPGDPNGGGASRKAIMGACEESLRRLRTGYIDLYWMHFADPYTPVEETIRTLEDLVRDGKVRYLGFSDTPAWKCVQAQMTAERFGWAPLVALQIEYNLLQRTVEGDLIPMAIEMGMGVTPWSPLKGGVLTGKYRKETAAETAKAGRGEWVSRGLNDRAYAVVDVLRGVAAEAGCSPSQAAIAWLLEKRGVSSVIIGARTMEQLDDNLGAAEVRLSAEQVSRLDDATTPTLPFPHEFLKNIMDNVQGGTTINGRPSKVWAMAPQTDAERH
jgi:aryl-alcohol dehydrogenase-like predicted oxidoreductase